MTEPTPAPAQAQPGAVNSEGLGELAILKLADFRRFWFAYSETNEAKLRAWVAEQPEHHGDCTKQSMTCPICLLADIEKDIAEYWPMLLKESE